MPSNRKNRIRDAVIIHLFSWFTAKKLASNQVFVIDDSLCQGSNGHVGREESKINSFKKGIMFQETYGLQSGGKRHSSDLEDSSSTKMTKA